MTGLLNGVRVVELASWTYVPSAGAALADWGAEVIKIEDTRGGDPCRNLVVGGLTVDDSPVQASFMMEIGNHGKRSIGVDIKSELGRRSWRSYSRRPMSSSPIGCRDRSNARVSPSSTCAS